MKRSSDSTTTSRNLRWRAAAGEGLERGSDDIIVSLLVEVLLDKLSSEASRDFGSVWCVQSELNALSDVLRKIQGLLKFAEQAQTKNILVKHCLRNLRDVAYRAEDILDEFMYEARKEKDERYHQRGKCKEVRFLQLTLDANRLLRKEEIVPFLNGELIQKLVEIEKKLEDHHPKGSEIRQSPHGVNDEMDTRAKSSSLVDKSFTLERKEDEDKVKNKLLSHLDENQNQVKVIAIVGLGGVGKTTLAQLVYNDPDVKEHFEKRAWACVSTDFDVVRVTSAILQSLKRRNPNLSELDPLQCDLEDELRGKRCLIVLDDVWTEEYNDWNVLRVAFKAAGEGSRIIVTARSRRVSSMMHPLYTHELGILSDEECWSIMERRIFVDHGSVTPNLEEVGRNIARKCRGLPLAASTLAGLLHSNSDPKHWEEVLNSSMWDLEGNNLPGALSLSYYFLPPYLKQCFAYCSLFPKDYLFDKQHLVQLWIAEGFIRSNSTSRMMKDKGCQYFDDLLYRSFFQHDNEYEDRFVMHDLVHDLAEAVSGEVYGRLECGESCHSFKETRFLSICCLVHINKDKNHVHKRLSTLTKLHRPCITYTLKMLIIESFGGLRYLRVLDLSRFDVEKLPDDIGELKYLHYIDLSHSRYIKRLPESLCNLHNLQSLILRHCGIRELPKGMKYLRNLQHLDLYKCDHLCSMPQGIGRLSNLKTLSRFPVSKDDGCGIRELKELWQLEGVLSISLLENVTNPQYAQEVDLMDKRKVEELELEWSRNNNGDGQDEVFEGLRPHNELKCLKINNYNGLTFPRWLMIDLPNYNKLVSLALTSCRKCRVLPPVIGVLPLLESLHLYHMTELEEWSSSCRGKETTEFPSLLRLTIDKCFKLRMLPQPLLSSPRLRELTITECQSLSLLPCELSKLTSLKNLALGFGMEALHGAVSL